MIYIFIAGIFNALGTFTLKLSNSNFIILPSAIFFYGINFFCFRLGLKNNTVSVSYILLTVTSLVTLLIIDLFNKNISLNPSVIISSFLMIISLYIFFSASS